jgi:arylsulfatase A-like enzyme
MLVAVDESTKAIVGVLRKIGQLDNTLIVLTSDHGYFYGEHGLSTERRLAFEESIRIPLVIWHPKLIPTPRRVENTVLSIDLAPTLMELGDAKPPEELHGRSLVPLIRGEAFPMQRDVLVPYFSDTVFPRVRRMGYAAVRTDRWKYVQYKEQVNADELYDLASDPYEMKNLVTDAASRKAHEEMKQRLAAALDAAH